MKKDVLEIANWGMDSFDDGPGIRTVLFLQGCSKNCPGCHNAKTHARGKGLFQRVDEIVEQARTFCRNKRITISGGEPLEQLDGLISLLETLRKEGFDICLYTGWDVASIPSKVVSLINYLKTGHFVPSLRQAALQYVGSSNQQMFQIVDGELHELDIGRVA